MLRQKVFTLSEGQKGLLSMCCLILDEPTNHINFRHLKALANAIKKFEGAVVLVSHDSEFVGNVDITHTIDLGYELSFKKK
jgi:ATPase subunit of ABC transporter with duplicated ATPase domains